jgi:hypothetical protein
MLVASLCEQIQIGIVDILEHTHNQESADEVLLEDHKHRLHAELQLVGKVVILDIWLEIEAHDVLN